MVKKEGSKSNSYAECFTQTGLIHMKKNMECEDVIVTKEQNDLLFYGLADGQSGKKYCRQGAKVVLNAIAEYLAEKEIHNLSQYKYVDEIQFEIIRIVRENLARLAAIKHTTPEELSSTILVLGIDTKTGEYITVHLGDGGIIGSKTDGSLNFISAPENGITNKYTWLTTSEGALLHLRIGFGKIGNYTRVTMFTDGADAICRGTNISPRARSILTENGDASQIADIIWESIPSDDASCIVVDCKQCHKA